MSVHYPREWLAVRDVGEHFAAHRQSPGLLARTARAFAAWRRRARERRDLYGMTGKDLRDIGITRADIPRVFGADFAREYGRRGVSLVRTARR